MSESSALAPGIGWTVGTALLDGGRGDVEIDVTSAGCERGGVSAPSTLSGRVLTPSGRSYPFEVVLDRAALEEAARQRCRTS